jgi:hypothetical protein
VPTQALTSEELATYKMKFKGYKEAFLKNEEINRQVKSIG